MAFLEHALAARNLRVDGFMTIAPLSEDPEVATRTFENLRAIRDDLAGRFRVPLRELSMGSLASADARRLSRRRIASMISACSSTKCRSAPRSPRLDTPSDSAGANAKLGFGWNPRV